MVMKSPERVILEHCLILNFFAINNEAEYEALIAVLRSSKKLLVLELYIFSDSKLVINQVTEKFKTRRAKMAK